VLLESLPVGPQPGRSRAPRVESKPTAASPTLALKEPSDIYNIADLGFDPHLAALAGTDALAAERYRTLAARLLSLTDRLKLKSLLITSAEPSEGKTTVAINIAWALAKRPGRRVLLVDANPEPAVGRALGLYRKGASWAAELVRLDPNRLYVLTQPLPLETVLAELAPQFDLLVVDSASILQSVETQRLAGALDGAVIVARAGRTNRRKVSAARKLIPKPKRLGLVLNESDFEAERPISNQRKKSMFGGKS
jgi:Mrp family chromosome partitioning ATPase